MLSKCCGAKIVRDPSGKYTYICSHCGDSCDWSIKWV